MTLGSGSAGWIFPHVSIFLPSDGLAIPRLLYVVTFMWAGTLRVLPISCPDRVNRWDNGMIFPVSSPARP